jgi:hypothetical protein
MSDESSAHPGTVKVLGMEIPLPAWAAKPMGVVAAVAVLASLGLTVYHKQIDATTREAFQRTEADLLKARNELQNARDSLRNARDDYEEYVRHTSEPGSEFHREPHLTVKYYESDGCLYVLRASSGQWLRDTSKRAPGGVVGASYRRAVESWAALVMPAAYRPAEEQSSRGGCLNPHPGKYQSADGERRGCRLQVWRRWPDGCVHYQWFNTCTSLWELDGRGQPAVHWTACRH